MRIFFLLCLCLGISSSAVAVEISQKPETKAPSLEEKLQKLEQSFSSLQKHMQNNAVSDSKELERHDKTLGAQVLSLKDQINGLKGDIEQIQFDNARINERLVKFASDVEYKISQMKKGITDAEKSNPILEDIDEQLDNDLIFKGGGDAQELLKQPKVEDKYIQAKKEERTSEELYQDAYSFLKERDYRRARKAFQKFVKKHPDTELTGNAYYWLGETYFLRAEFEKAAVEYLKGYQSNIRGSRAADNLLKLSKSLAKIERRKEACTTLGKLRKEFPNATNTIKKKMTEDIKTLRCGT